jgi:hypothetical protein
MVPVAVQALVGHLQYTADIGGLALVEEEIGLGRVGVDAVVALEETERNQRVEEVARGAGMKPEAGAEFGEWFGVFSELGEDLHLHRAEEGFGGPEAEANLHDVVGP